MSILDAAELLTEPKKELFEGDKNLDLIFSSFIFARNSPLQNGLFIDQKDREDIFNSLKNPSEENRRDEIQEENISFEFKNPDLYY